MSSGRSVCPSLQIPLYCRSDRECCFTLAYIEESATPASVDKSCRRMLKLVPWKLPGVCKPLSVMGQFRRRAGLCLLLFTTWCQEHNSCSVNRNHMFSEHATALNHQGHPHFIIWYLKWLLYLLPACCSFSRQGLEARKLWGVHIQGR